MKVSIDFSIFTEDLKATGSVSGSIELVAVPAVGDKVLLTSPANGVPFPFAGFDGHLMVERRIFTANATRNALIVLLSNLIVPTESDVLSLTEYLEKGFGFFVDIYDDK